MTAAADPAPHIDPDAAEAWLDLLYSEFDDGWLTLFSVDRTNGARHVDWFAVTNYTEVAERAVERAATCDVWHGVATRRERLPYGRGGDADCAALPGLWLDVDIAGPGHRGGHTLPPDVDAAKTLIMRFAEQPTVVVHSGGGLQAWWLFREPMPVDDETPALLARWGATWAAYGKERGWHVDNVFDIARVMRLPGTLNRKVAEPRPVHVTMQTGYRYNPSDLDQWLVDPPSPPEPSTPARVPYIGPERPGDAFNAARSGGDILRAAGWTLTTIDRNGDQHWTRPGKDPRQGTSATVYAEDGHTTIWSDTVTAQHPTLETRRPYDPFGLYTHLFHGGDWRAASITLEAQGYGTRARVHDDLSWLGLDNNTTPPAAAAPPDDPDDDPDDIPGSSWRPADLGELYDGIVNNTIERPRPTIGRFVTGGTALYYPGRINGLYGESGIGKSWIALALAEEVLSDGGTVAWIDLEEPAEGILTRLIDLGVGRDPIVNRFLYVAPEESIRVGGELFAELDNRRPDLVVIDSTGEALALEGAGPNNDDEVANWFRTWPRRLARRYGACVLVIDHVVKDEQNRGLFPGGSQRKRAAITGSAFMVEGTRRDSLGKGTTGTLTLTCAKDRHGTHRRGETAARFTLNGGATPYRWELAPPAAPQTKRDELADVMERISNYLAEVGEPVPKSKIERFVPGRAIRVRDALEMLIEEGYVRRTPAGNSHLHSLVRPFNRHNDAIMKCIE